MKQEMIRLMENLIEWGNLEVTAPPKLADLAKILKIAGLIWLRIKRNLKGDYEKCRSRANFNRVGFDLAKFNLTPIELSDTPVALQMPQVDFQMLTAAF